MRPLLIAVLLLSCAGDEARRSPAPRAAEPGLAPSAASRKPPDPTLADTIALTASAPAPSAGAPTPSAGAPAEHTPAPAEPVAARSPLLDPRTATRQAAHDALAANCGECHEGHRSHTPKALAVFDLDLPDWPTRFNDHRFASALGRLQSKSESASAAFLAFRDAERATSSATATATTP